MRVIEKPKKVVRIRIDEMEDGKNLPGCESIHLTDTTANEIYLAVVKALGIQDQILQMKGNKLQELGVLKRNPNPKLQRTD